MANLGGGTLIPIPEPSSVFLLATGVVALMFIVSRRGFSVKLARTPDLDPDIAAAVEARHRRFTWFRMRRGRRSPVPSPYGPGRF
jgi:hypothetical protein